MTIRSQSPNSMWDEARQVAKGSKRLASCVKTREVSNPCTPGEGGWARARGVFQRA